MESLSKSMSSRLKTCAPLVSHREQLISHDSGDARPEKLTNVMASPAHFLFHAGSWAPHLRHKGCLVWTKAAGSVGQFIWCHYSRAAALSSTVIWFATFPLDQTVTLSIFRFSHFHNGFCGHIAADGNGLPLVHRGFCGALYSPPDLTPFTLDKHNKKEKLKFYVRGWVITCRKKKRTL